MVLTSNDETDLLLPLYQGLDEIPRFATFLERLRRRTGARAARLIIGGEPASEADGLPVDLAVLRRMRFNRLYGPGELADLDEGRSEPPPRDRLSADFRAVRFPLAGREGGWLLIESTRSLRAVDGALVAGVVPYVQSVLSARDDILRDRAAALLSSMELARGGSGWMLFDREARMLACDPKWRDRLGGATGTLPQTGERLRAILPAAERALTQALARFETDPTLPPAPILFLAAPRIEAILEPVDPGSDIARAFPSSLAIAWCRGTVVQGAQRIGALAGLYELPPREAELAIALADGRSLAQAADDMGLTLETARNYSKRLYAKLDVSGQAQLVRLVLNSGAALA